MKGIPVETDAVIIGSGVSGLAAALTLVEGGARVIVFEKQDSIGGTSVNFRGIFATESSMQRQRYITYSRDQAFRNIMEYSHWRANPRLVRAIVDESSETIDWLQSQGVEFCNVTTNIPDDPHTYHVVNGSGETVVKVLAAQAKKLGALVMLATPVKQILKTGKRITRVVVEQNKEDVQISTKAVIIASGGYANNKEWIKKYTGFDLGANAIPVGNVGKMGDGIRMAFQAGAAEEGLGILEFLRSIGHLDPALGPHIGYTVVQPNLWINSRGERFCDESIVFYDTSMGNASARQKNGNTYSIFDSAIVRYLMEKGIDKAMMLEFPPGSRLPTLKRELENAIANKSNEVFKADSLQELAAKINVDPTVLKSTVDEYNGFCDKHHDDLFAKDPKYLRPIRGPQFFAVKARTVFLGTIGGIKINHRAEVIDKQDRIIPGLYAVGFDAGGMYGDSYCITKSSGLSSSFAVNSGRIAGKNALRYLGE
jgi:fumarate reductase flavoprotein subunit